ncbi:MAG: M48 family metallopeptidase [Clostridia bacterium]|nr:M48 family metallopeptidase [Clostridia bacterium]
MQQYPFQVKLIRSARKTLAVQVSGPDAVTVRAPNRMPLYAIRQFIDQHRQWINAHLQKARVRQEERGELVPFTQAQIDDLARRAARDLPQRVSRFAALVGVDYGRITVRCQHTRWGSCSSKGNLNFNCLLMLCPDAVIDYVVVHELCHRREMNHSPRFWAEVARALPDYPRARDWLRQEGQKLIARLPE